MNDPTEKIGELFPRAERLIKHVEQINDGVSIPGINQLRYVGSHMLKAQTARNDDEKAVELAKAMNHCERAIYDAAECGILYYLAQLQIFELDYRQEVITDFVSDMSSIRNNAKEARTFVTENSVVNPGGHVKKSHEYARSEEFLERIEADHSRYSNVRIDINKRMAKERRKMLGALIAFTVALIGTIAAVIGASDCLPCP